MKSRRKRGSRKRRDGKSEASPAPATTSLPSLAATATAGEATTRVDGYRFASSERPARRRPPQLAPYATVRIAGRATRRGARIDVLSVKAPGDARATVRCRGRDCPVRQQSRIVSASVRTARATRISFRRMERHLRAGTVIEVSITKEGMIGKFTRFVIRALKPPLRDDLCLPPGSSRPKRCS